VNAVMDTLIAIIEPQIVTGMRIVGARCAMREAAGRALMCSVVLAMAAAPTSVAACLLRERLGW